jgi:hypothetical protein
MDLYESDIQTKLDTLNNDPLDSSGVDTFMSEVTALHTDITAEFYSVTTSSTEINTDIRIRRLFCRVIICGFIPCRMEVYE